MSKPKTKENESDITIEGITYDFIVDEKDERKLLGKGGGGTVYLAVNNGKEYAIKEYTVTKKNGKSIRNENEIEFLCDPNNPCENIVKVLGKEYIGNRLYIVMDKFPYTLRTIIARNNSYDTIFRIILQLIHALKYIHSQNIYHRDLKPENVLVDNSKNVYICDFGIAHFPNKRITNPDDCLANRNYMAPEAHIIGNSRNVTAAIDIYPLGKMINELFTKENPVGTHFRKIADIYPQFASLDDLVDRMMNQNPAERPSIEEVETRVRFEKETFEEKIQILSQHLLLTGEQNGKTDRICKLASLDIYIANLIYTEMDEEHLNAVDINYHQNIHYSATEEFKNYFFQFLLLKECEKKYWGESSSCDEDWDSTGIKQRTTKTQYSKMVSILKGRNKIPKDFQPVQGKILKIFSSCKNYHSDEVLQFCARAKQMVDELNDFPLYYFVKYADKCLKNLLHNELDEIRLEKYIVLNTDISSGKMKNTSIIRKDIYAKRNKLCGILKRLYQCEIITTGECVITHFERDKYTAFKDKLLLKANKFVSRYPDENRYFMLDVNSALTIVNSTESVVELFFDSFTLDQILGKLYSIK